jgi:hypothetical protein
MMHCSCPSGHWATWKRVCPKRRTEAYSEDALTENLLNCIPKKNHPICRECRIQKRMASLRLMA